jgi:hypothetical protein
MLRTGVRSAFLGALLIGLSDAAGAAPQAKQPARVNASAAVIQDFLKRVDGYVAVHKKLEATLPKLPEQTTPQQIDTHQRALAALIQAARKDAKPGDLLAPAMQQRIRALLRPVFTGKDGRQIKDEILDREYKGNVKLAVNGRYPDEVPISTVPPQVLLALPKLPEELEYRFIQNSLILFDPHAHIIVDYMDRAFI